MPQHIPATELRPGDTVTWHDGSQLLVTDVRVRQTYVEFRTHPDGQGTTATDTLLTVDRT
jgi:hypothetical protein